MAVYLVQHGKSMPKELDSSRALSESGIKEVEHMASMVEKYGIIDIFSTRH